MKTSIRLLIPAIATIASAVASACGGGSDDDGLATLVGTTADKDG